MKVLATIFLLLAAIANASDGTPAGSYSILDNTQVSEREPLGSTTWMFDDRKKDTVTYSNSVSGSNWTLKVNYYQPMPLPNTYKDPDSGIIFYVESDGRHVSAIGPDGKILWNRDPHTDAHLSFYRVNTPRITLICKAPKRDEDYFATNGFPNIISVSYENSQYGFLKVTNGDFILWGQR